MIHPDITCSPMKPARDMKDVETVGEVTSWQHCGWGDGVWSQSRQKERAGSTIMKCLADGGKGPGSFLDW